MQNTAEFIFAQSQPFGDDQPRAQDMRSDGGNFFDVRFSERDQRQGQIFFVSRDQHFRTDDSRFQKSLVQLLFLFGIDRERFALLQRDVFKNFADALGLVGQ